MPWCSNDGSHETVGIGKAIADACKLCLEYEDWSELKSQLLEISSLHVILLEHPLEPPVSHFHNKQWNNVSMHLDCECKFDGKFDESHTSKTIMGSLTFTVLKI